MTTNINKFAIITPAPGPLALEGSHDLPEAAPPAIVSPVSLDGPDTPTGGTGSTLPVSPILEDLPSPLDSLSLEDLPSLEDSAYLGDSSSPEISPTPSGDDAPLLPRHWPFPNHAQNQVVQILPAPEGSPALVELNITSSEASQSLERSPSLEHPRSLEEVTSSEGLSYRGDSPSPEILQALAVEAPQALDLDGSGYRTPKAPPASPALGDLAEGEDILEEEDFLTEREGPAEAESSTAGHLAPEDAPPEAPPVPTRAAPEPPSAAPTRSAPLPSLQPPPPPLYLTAPPTTPQVEAFFNRHSLSPTARQLCWDFVFTQFPHTSPQSIHECPSQGYCSYTLLISPPSTTTSSNSASLIIQFRPPTHRLNTTLSSLARKIHPAHAPQTHSLGVLSVPSITDPQTSLPLLVYSMSLTPGIPLTTFRLIPPRSAGEVHLQRANLVRDFARFLAIGWENRLPTRIEVLSNLPIRGKLGVSLRQRLEKMRDELPARFKPVVVDVLKSLPEIEALPWVLTHGDVVSDNIMVEPPPPATSSSSSAESYRNRSTGHWPGSLHGLIDWAESEYLPFGICLYGVEELFGQTVRTWDPTAQKEEEQQRSRFAYYPSAGDLRRLFWHEMEVAIPPLAKDRELRGAVEQARLLGILLWHGFAFDDGRIDRVVEEGRDRDEVQRLDMFLFGTDEREVTERGVTGGGGGGEGDKGIEEGGKRKGKKKLAKGKGKEKDNRVVGVSVGEQGNEREKEVSKGQKFLRRMSSMISLHGE